MRLSKNLEKLKLKRVQNQKQYFRYFLRQGSFSLHYSKDMDYFVKEAYENVLKDYFEDFLPQNELVPICILANEHFATNSLCMNEALPLILVYKDIKAFHLKPMIKAFIEALNDLKFELSFKIIELKGLKNIAKDTFLSPQLRFICGSKFLFKELKNDFNNFLKENKENLAKSVLLEFKNQNIPFLKQEFHIKKDPGGLNDLRKLETLLALFKDSPKNYALYFMDEKALSKLRLASEFLLNLKSALNLNANKDDDEFLLFKLEKLAKLLHKKDQKNFKAEELLMQKTLQSRHIICLYSAFLALKIRQKYFKNEALQGFALNQNFKSLNEVLNYLNLLEDKAYEFSTEWVFVLFNLNFSKENLEKNLQIFEKFFYRKNSFCILKLLLDSGILKEFYKQFPRFLCDEMGDYSFDSQAFLTLFYFEKEEQNLETLKKLNTEERMIIKFVIILSTIRGENEVSMASIYRSYAAKFHIKAENFELGLRLFKNYDALKELVEKDDVYNPVVLLNLLSRIKDLKTLELLYILTLIRAKALGANAFFYKVLDRLFKNAKEGFSDENLLEESTKRVKKELTLKRSKIFLEQDKILQEKITHIKSNLFIIKNSFEDIVNIAKIAQNSSFKFWLENAPNLNLQLVALKDFELNIILTSLANLNLVFMSFYELFDDKIYLRFEYENIISKEQKERLIKLLNSSLKAPLKNKIKKPIIKKDELKFDLNYSKNYAKLNLNTKDQQGLIAFLMNAFKKFGLSLSAAKIQTIRQRTRNTFIFQKNEALLDKEQELITSLISE